MYLPPKKITGLVGPGHYIEMGKKFLGFFVELGGLKSTDTVVDIGSGNARMAYPLKDFLTTGEYYGQEIVKEAVDWSRKAYEEHENFHFIHADIFSKRYNPTGKLKAAEYRFPIENNMADFVFLTSVFTHMLTADVVNYVAEISRFTKRGANVFVTCFLINEESEKYLQEGKSKEPFKPYDENTYTVSVEVPESAVAYKEAFFLDIFSSYGLEVKNTVRYGRWCGRKDFTAYQDIVVFSKL